MVSKKEIFGKPLERLSLHVVVAHKLNDLLLSLAAVSVEWKVNKSLEAVNESSVVVVAYRKELPRDKTRVLRLGIL